MQPILAVDQRARTGGPDVPIRQAQFGQQRRHLGTAYHERLRADVHGNPADLLGTQHSAEPVGRVEQRDARLVAEGHPQPVCRCQTRDSAADNTIRVSHLNSFGRQPRHLPRRGTPMPTWAGLHWPLLSVAVDTLPVCLGSGCCRRLLSRWCCWSIAVTPGSYGTWPWSNSNFGSRAVAPLV